MEDNSKIPFDEYSEKKVILYNENNIKKKTKTKKIKIKKFLSQTTDTIKNKIIKYNIKFSNNNSSNNENNNKKIKKVRNPGIDLVRLISMYFIIINHILYKGKALNIYPKYKRQIILLHIFTDFHNNAFILISGIVGYKTNRYSNLLYLWLTVYFYAVTIHIYVIKFKKDFLLTHDINKDYYPIIYERYWFFTAYFGMYLFLPLINKGIEYLSKFELRLVVMSILGVFVFWRDYKNPKKDIFKLSQGNSVLWFQIFYITGAFIGKYRVNYSGLKKFFYCFICFFIYYLSSYLYYKSFFNELPIRKGHYQKQIILILKGILTERFDSFLKIAQSIFVCLFFMQISYNKYIAKIICFLGPLVFGIYLIHAHPLINDNVLKHVFDNEPKDLRLNSVIKFVLWKSFKIFFFGIFVDYFRNLLFNLLRLKKIFMFVEVKMYEIFK